MPYIDFKQLKELETTCTSAASISWHSAAKSHAGLVRKANEDAFYHSSEHGLWAVADGMGGLNRGDYASGVVAESLVHFMKASSLAESVRDLEMKLRDAHNLCRTSFPGEQVGSTVAVLFNYGSHVFFLWAGDSRIYRLRNNTLTQLTTDHSVAQTMIARGQLRPAQAEHHPSAHVLTRAVGVHQTLHLELDFDCVEPGDRFLICSDGLYKDLTVDDIEQLLAQDTADNAVRALIDGALNKGGRDNITAIVVDAD
ncbi:serine/threonine-protein phosphatase [Aurantivibrio plasticivorans]